MEEKKENSPACIPFFAHENTMMHYNLANKRMLIALICVCVTFIVTICVFVSGYTAREKNWLDTMTRLQGVEVQAVYDYLHEMQMDEAAQVKAKQMLYRE